MARTLTDGFFRSFHSRAMELWVTELSLTPSFDEDASLALDAERHHGNGRAGWEHLMQFSFLEHQPDGSFRMHKTMREAIRERIGDDLASKSTCGSTTIGWDATNSCSPSSTCGLSIPRGR